MNKRDAKVRALEITLLSFLKSAALERGYIEPIKVNVDKIKSGIYDRNLAKELNRISRLLQGVLDTSEYLVRE